MCAKRLPSSTGCTRSIRKRCAKPIPDGDIHLHDLGFFGPYCAGWDLKQLLMDGFGGVEGKVESSAPKHLRSFLGQIVNSTFTTQGETAGAPGLVLDRYVLRPLYLL